jgi:calcium permeable stress-gated cation channel
MANWYNGVLKYVHYPFSASRAHPFAFPSTGKRRYGHPALNGVLPEPWLPLKKGQTLVNNDRAASRRPKDDHQAVVLTLRKRPSIGPRARRRSAPLDVDLLGLGGGPGERSDVVGDTESNPWRDSRGRLSRSQTAPASSQRTLNHRLSFDPASGVIALPEAEDWIDDSESSDEELEAGEDQDADAEAVGHNGAAMQSPSASTATIGPAEASSSAIGAAEPPSPVSARGEGSLTASTSSPSRRSRYGTYYHHPERRRQQIPGAFPK